MRHPPSYPPSHAQTAEPGLNPALRDARTRELMALVTDPTVSAWEEAHAIAALRDHWRRSGCAATVRTLAAVLERSQSGIACMLKIADRLSGMSPRTAGHPGTTTDNPDPLYLLPRDALLAIAQQSTPEMRTRQLQLLLATIRPSDLVRAATMRRRTKAGYARTKVRASTDRHTALDVPHACSGPLKARAREYLRLRHSLGVHIHLQSHTLWEFDGYLAATCPTLEPLIITAAMVVGYMATTTHLHPGTRSHRLGDIRQFCRFLAQYEPATYVPPPGLLANRALASTLRFRPHIYTEAEVVALMAGAAQQVVRPGPTAQRVLVRLGCATIIGLLWVTGMRIGEVVRLNIDDVDLERGILHIHRTKFYQSRLVPVASSTTAALAHYVTVRTAAHGTAAPHDPFFTNTRRVRYTPDAVRLVVKQLAAHAGITNARGTHPRLHDFRHTFATRCLTAAVQATQDPGVVLPILATYLGHQHLFNTDHYLHPFQSEQAQQTMDTASTQFRAYTQPPA